ncbi:hypothetical protein TRVL_03158 [Trypanosoma vivax]|uniref:Uncharacterized protein n=1 Tax=Trypanosoma vivax (strain Y486) TaxID=1055687 RepID=G0U8B9_TRYVY|nr:hypothetical protein TRVL_03158 [Trypanosoma vivax]CCC53842.1 conserved hypothetical protein [Trypanosoma vivax Y486]
MPYVMKVVHQHYPTREKGEVAWGVGTKILGFLQELELVYKRIEEFRSNWRHGELTREERRFEELIRQRVGEDIGASKVGMKSDKSSDGDKPKGGCASAGLFEGAPNSSDRGVEGDEEPDVAMCFNLEGELLGIGSAGLFGGHGYRSEPYVAKRDLF